MPKLTPFEAPMTGYDLQDKGIVAFRQSAATAREAGQQIEHSMHQEGAALDAGMKTLAQGIDNATSKPKTDKHDDLMAAVGTNNEATQLHMDLMTSYNTALTKGRESNDPQWLEKWTNEEFNQKISTFQASAANDKDGQSRLGYVKGWQSHFLFTRGPADELDRATESVKTSYNQTKDTAMTSVVGGGNIKPDGSEATMLQALNLSDTALQNVLKTGIGVNYKQMADAHAKEQHGLVMASAETRLKSATSPEEVDAALKEIRDPSRAWVKNRYGLEPGDYKTLEAAADHATAKLNSAASGNYTRSEHEAKQAYNATTNDMLSKAYSRTYDPAKDDKLDDVLKQHGAFINADQVSAFRKNVAYIQNHPGENTLTDMNTYQGFMTKAGKGELTAQELVQGVKDGKITEENMKNLHSINSMVAKDEFQGNAVNAMLRTADIVHGKADFNTGVITDKEDAIHMLRFRTQFYPAMQDAKRDGKFDNARDLDIDNPNGLAYQVGHRPGVWRTPEERAANPLGTTQPEVKSAIPATLSHINPKYLQVNKAGEFWNELTGELFDKDGKKIQQEPQAPHSR